MSEAINWYSTGKRKKGRRKEEKRKEVIHSGRDEGREREREGREREYNRRKTFL